MEATHRHLEADSIVLAVGMTPANGISVEELRDQIPEVHPIADYLRPRYVLSAMWEGY